MCFADTRRNANRGFLCLESKTLDSTGIRSTHSASWGGCGSDTQYIRLWHVKQLLLFVRCAGGACLPSVLLTQFDPTHTLHSRSTTATAECAQAWHTPVAANTRCAHGHLRTHQQASTQHNRHAGTGTTDTQAQAHAHAYIHTGTTDTQAHAHAHAYIHAGIHAR